MKMFTRLFRLLILTLPLISPCLYAHPYLRMACGQFSIIIVDDNEHVCVYHMEKDTTQCIDWFNEKKIRAVAIGFTYGIENFYALTEEGQIFCFRDPLNLKIKPPEQILDFIDGFQDIQSHKGYVAALSLDGRLFSWASLREVNAKFTPFDVTESGKEVVRFWLNTDKMFSYVFRQDCLSNYTTHKISKNQTVTVPCHIANTKKTVPTNYAKFLLRASFFKWTKHNHKTHFRAYDRQVYTFLLCLFRLRKSFGVKMPKFIVEIEIIPKIFTSNWLLKDDQQSML